jgi:hypothetical protein
MLEVAGYPRRYRFGYFLDGVQEEYFFFGVVYKARFQQAGGHEGFFQDVEVRRFAASVGKFECPGDFFLYVCCQGHARRRIGGVKGFCPGGFFAGGAVEVD